MATKELFGLLSLRLGTGASLARLSICVGGFSRATHPTTTLRLCTGASLARLSICVEGFSMATHPTTTVNCQLSTVNCQLL
ncbi:MAG: hypothetical protein JGK32_16305 [Microcoleus sp. PH2017_31_RDM_U_A]|nr:hypothetical protein [Microcoleus sp. PH2017_31_RDM_U_A]